MSLTIPLFRPSMWRKVVSELCDLFSKIHGGEKVDAFAASCR
jgi:hypothetical protein